MKIAKGITFFSILAVIFGSCFDAPNFPDEPRIELEDVTFVETPNTSLADTLIIALRFKDGDGDLGLDATQINEPFHQTNFYVANANDELLPIPTIYKYINLPPLISVPQGVTGKLVSNRTDKATTYTKHYYNSSETEALTLPQWADANCTNYLFDSLYVEEKDKSIFEGVYTPYKVLTSNLGNPNVYVLLDTFYYERNPSHYNITVDFEVFDAADPSPNPEDKWKPFNWRTIFPYPNCGESFDGRFPILADDSSPLEGVIRYRMVSSGFIPLFGNKPVRLKIQIADRSLRKSNIIITPGQPIRDF